MTAIAVTGATGFVGRRLVARLVADGHTVRALGRPESAGKLPAGVAHAPWSLDDGGDPSALAGTDVLVHAAAYIPANHASLAEAGPCWQRNALATLQLCEAAAAAAVAHVVHLSSGNAYKQQPRAVHEDDPQFPSARAAAYLTSKVASEVFADHVGRVRGMAVAILRLSAVYGPGMVAAGMVPSFAQRLLRGEVVTVDHGGRYQADLVHVDDVVDAIVAAITRRARGPFNIGSGHAVTSLDVARALAAAAGRDDDAVRITGEPSGDVIAGFSPLAIDRARAELGYAPRTIALGLASTLASFRG